PVARRVLQARVAARRLRALETRVEAFPDRLEPACLALAHVGARMEDHVRDAEGMGPFELLDERLAAVLQRRFLRGCEVDEVVRVDEDPRDPMLDERGLEAPGLVGGSG